MAYTAVVNIVPGELMVRLRAQDRGAGPQFAQAHGFELCDRFELSQRQGGDLLHLRLPAGVSTTAALQQLAGDEQIAYAEPNYVYEFDEVRGQALLPPNDLHNEQWALHNTGQMGGKVGADVHALAAWKLHQGRCDGPIVAVIDTGIDLTHPELVDNLWVNPGEIPGDGVDNDGNGVIDDVHGYNANGDNGNPNDDYGHGTHVAGILGAVGNNGQGITGIAPKARLMAIKIHDEHGSTNAAAIVRGLLYAQKMGATITNNSWGGPQASQSIADAFNAFPALHVMSAGNDGKNNDVVAHFPGNFDIPNKLVVAASDRNDERPRYSNYGKDQVHLAAPGDDIFSTYKGACFAYKSGTSMAAPLVAGAASLVASARPCTPEQLKQILLDSADRLPDWKDKVASGARLNLEAALQLALRPSF